MSQDDGRKASESSEPAQGEPASQAQVSTLSLPSVLPETYGVDEVGVLCKDPWWYFVYWEVTEAGLEAAGSQLGVSAEQARLVLRVLISAGERRGRDPRDIRDIPVDMAVRHGRRYLEAPRPNAVFRVAIGLLSPEGLFAPIAHSPTVRMPPQQASSETSIEWLHVLPNRSEGRQRERIVAASHAHSERVVPARPGVGDGRSPVGEVAIERIHHGGSSALQPARLPDGDTSSDGDKARIAEVRLSPKQES
ncbi:MAG: DUF4912 domain-containing protein [Elusimicrobia bacterium]|nr:MAG: DUF4912 domain-containing protein [Elusimicrobiota bacterium]